MTDKEILDFIEDIYLHITGIDARVQTLLHLLDTLEDEIKDIAEEQKK